MAQPDQQGQEAMEVLVGYNPNPSLCVQGLCILFPREFYENYFSLGLAVKRTGT